MIGREQEGLTCSCGSEFKNPTLRQIGNMMPNVSVIGVSAVSDNPVFLQSAAKVNNAGAGFEQGWNLSTSLQDLYRLVIAFYQLEIECQATTSTHSTRQGSLSGLVAPQWIRTFALAFTSKSLDSTFPARAAHISADSPR